MSALAVPEAARALGVPVGRMRRWIAQGAPVAARGGRGRGRAVLVDLDAVRAWRAAQDADDTGREALRLELQAAVPGIVADATLAALANASPRTQTGAELRAVRDALGDAARLTAAALLDALQEKSKRDD